MPPFGHVKDLNKNIVTYNGNNGIEYNHLNLPKKVTLKKDASNNKGWVEYTYDALGNKLRKTTYEPGVDTTITLYVGGVVYQNDTFQFTAHEEGRLRYRISDNSFQYDYFIKDHLGNVRMVLTDEQKTDTYPAASLETAQLATERALYSGVDTGRVARAGTGYPVDVSYTNPNDYIQMLGSSTSKIGMGIVLKVMAGDKFNLRANSWWNSGSTPGTPVNPLNLLLGILNTNIGAIPNAHGSTSELNNSGVLSAPITDFLTSHSGYTTSKPKAFVNWVLFDEQFKYVTASSGFEQVGNSNAHTTHTKTNLPVTKSGYLYIYVSNETPNIDVFFDNLQVTHARGALLEETHYYPFGLMMNGISSKALSFGNPENNKNKFQNQELNVDLGVNYYEFKWRHHDPQIGRFIQIDPLSDKYVYNSAYAFSENKVTNNIELEGLESAPCGYLYNSGATQQQHNDFAKGLERTHNQGAKYFAVGVGSVLAIAFPQVGGPIVASLVFGVPSPSAPTSMVSAATSEISTVASEIKTTTTEINVIGNESKVASEGIKTTVNEVAVDTKATAPNFIVDKGGQVFPVPKGATGPIPADNGKGVKFIGGSGGANGQVTTMRIMDPVAAKGNAPGYPNGYIKYQNSSGQGVNPYTGQTGSKAATHFPLLPGY